jgi:hypothetical protein
MHSKLRSRFPNSSTRFCPNPLIKTYSALCESRRSIAPLQLLFLEIFKFYSKLLSSANCYTVKLNGTCAGHWRHRARTRVQSTHAAHVSRAPRSGVRTCCHLHCGCAHAVGALHTLGAVRRVQGTTATDHRPASTHAVACCCRAPARRAS